MKNKDTEAGDKPATGVVHMLPTAATARKVLEMLGCEVVEM